MAQSSATPDVKSSSTKADAPDDGQAAAAAPVDDKTAADGQKEATDAEAKRADADDAASDPEPEISLHQFLRVSGVQPDQAAGFVRWAQKNMAGRHGLTAWKQALADFWRAPAR